MTRDKATTLGDKATILGDKASTIHTSNKTCEFGDKATKTYLIGVKAAIQDKLKWAQSHHARSLSAGTEPPYKTN